MIAPTKHEQLKTLIGFGYSEKLIASWTDERIATVLASRRRDAALAVKRADHTAALIDGTSRGQPSKPERWQAAAYLEQVLDKGGDAIVNAVLYCGHVLSDDEARALAESLIALFRDGLVTRVERVEFEGTDEDAA